MFLILILIWCIKLSFTSRFDIRVISEFGNLLLLESYNLVFYRFFFAQIFVWDFLVHKNFRLVRLKIRVTRINFRMRYFFDRSVEYILLRIFFGRSSCCSSTWSSFWFLWRLILQALLVMEKLLLLSCQLSHDFSSFGVCGWRLIICQHFPINPSWLFAH